MQLKIRALVVTFYTMSIALLWFVKMQSCMSYVFTWYGMLPLQVCSSLPADKILPTRQVKQSLLRGTICLEQDIALCLPNLLVN